MNNHQAIKTALARDCLNELLGLPDLSPTESQAYTRLCKNLESWTPYVGRKWQSLPEIILAAATCFCIAESRSANMRTQLQSPPGAGQTALLGEMFLEGLRANYDMSAVCPSPDLPSMEELQATIERGIEMLRVAEDWSQKNFPQTPPMRRPKRLTPEFLAKEQNPRHYIERALPAELKRRSILVDRNLIAAIVVALYPTGEGGEADDADRERIAERLRKRDTLSRRERA